MTCPCGISLPACAADCDRDGTSERHDERIASLCPDCKAHQPEIGDLGARQDCIECGTTLEVRQHELMMCVSCDDCGRDTPEDAVEPVGRWEDEALVVAHLCSEHCAPAERRRQGKTRRQSAYEAYCDDVGDEMRMGGGL